MGSSTTVWPRSRASVIKLSRVMPSSMAPRARRVDHVVAHYKNVFARALGDIALRIEHDGFIEAGALRFGLGQNRAHVISRDLGFGHHDVGVQARERSNVGADAAFLRFCAQKSGPLPHCDDQSRLAAIHDQVHGAVQINDRADIARGEFIGGDRLVNGRRSACRGSRADRGSRR